MKKFAGIAAGLGAVALMGAGSATAAPAQTHVSGNFEYTEMSYWCDKGTPNFAFQYRTLNKTESSVTFSATGYRPYTEKNVAPYQTSNGISSLSNAAGRTVTIWAKGATTGSTFAVSGTVPKTCAGLPSVMPTHTWVGKPKAQPVKPSAPAPTKPSPATPKAPAAPAKPSAPAAPVAPKAPVTAGPKVETGTVAPAADYTSAYVAGGAALLTVAAAGAGVKARRACQ